ncbi:hypothetical protein [Jannaschia sp. R86511]|uniref:hypothetical protein n=1 Tax=Jannaschia sp. R86511 TaxID=3093853 RepID=UPI0036D34416
MGPLAAAPHPARARAPPAPPFLPPETDDETDAATHPSGATPAASTAPVGRAVAPGPLPAGPSAPAPRTPAPPVPRPATSPVSAPPTTPLPGTALVTRSSAGDLFARPLSRPTTGPTARPVAVTSAAPPAFEPLAPAAVTSAEPGAPAAVAPVSATARPTAPSTAPAAPVGRGVAGSPLTRGGPRPQTPPPTAASPTAASPAGGPPVARPPEARPPVARPPAAGPPAAGAAALPMPTSGVPESAWVAQVQGPISRNADAGRAVPPTARTDRAVAGAAHRPPDHAAARPGDRSAARADAPPLGGTDPTLRAADPTLRAADPALRAADPALRAADPALRAVDPALRAVDPAVRAVEMLTAELAATRSLLAEVLHAQRTQTTALRAEVDLLRQEVARPAVHPLVLTARTVLQAHNDALVERARRLGEMAAEGFLRAAEDVGVDADGMIALETWVLAGGRGVLVDPDPDRRRRLGCAVVLQLARAGRSAVLVAPRRADVTTWTDALREHVPTSTLRSSTAQDRSAAPSGTAVLVTTARAHGTGGARSGQAPALLLAVDAERFGAPSLAEALDQRCDWRLGLSSAYRRADDGLVRFTDPYFDAGVVHVG